MDLLCGRPTRKGTPCRSCHAWAAGYTAPACRRHLTEAERAELKVHEDYWAQVMKAAEAARPRTPACWSWPVTDADRQLAVDEQWTAHWQAGRCAVCGVTGDSRVVDHDHTTGWVRGILCTSCNGLEPGGGRLFERYRKHNPAKILGVWKRYSHPFYGLDRGELHGLRTAKPHPVDRDGQVGHAGPLTRRDPSELVSAALAAGWTIPPATS